MTGAAGSTLAALVEATEDVLAGESAADGTATATWLGAAVDVWDDTDWDDDAGLIACETAPPAIAAAIPAPATAQSIRRLMADHP
ncbi:MAG: hypothetical protein QOC59_1779 [Microbacteriaceae bacterium]|nr:hypothetical protein [Microbacteriaceae bacterium]